MLEGWVSMVVKFNNFMFAAFMLGAVSNRSLKRFPINYLDKYISL